MLRTPSYYTARQLSACADIPALYRNTGRLVYSSPATLAYNSPGAEGFGVKRAGLAVPGSVMLIVSPGCCGRNTSAITNIPGYRNRFFYLVMSETDLVTGRHLKRIPEAAVQIVRSLKVKPSVLMICITCVDALLGTDMERIARRAEKACGIPVRPCYMYALTREGRRPPMVHVRESIYSLLRPKKKVSTSVNLLGYFAPLMEKCELRNQLKSLGVRRIREISTCRDIEDFYDMAEANFNLVLNPEARPAAEDLWERLKIPYIELTRLYQIDQIERQAMALGKALGYDGLKSPKRKAEAEDSVRTLKERCPDLGFAVGEACNANPFELSLALLRYGFRVPEIFGTPSDGDKVYLDQIAALSPETKVYSNMDPSMVWYAAGGGESGRRESGSGQSGCRQSGSGASLIGKRGDAAGCAEHDGTVRYLENDINARYRENNGYAGYPENDGYAAYRENDRKAGYRENDRNAGYPENDGIARYLEKVDVTIGKDASFYHPEARHVYWNSDVQPYGYAGVRLLFEQILKAVEEGDDADRITFASFSSEETREERETAAFSSFSSEEGQEERKTAHFSSFSSEDRQEERKTTDFVSEERRNERERIPLDSVKEADIKGFRRVLTPFAPDQSGAEAVLFQLGGILIILDAGGCTGNICGFDEPRWGRERAAVFSAGLRDMDAIMGRDTLLVKKAAKAQEEINAAFLAYIGTPVPAVIGTDYQALTRMTERQISVPVLSVSTNGFELYDQGEVKAYQALFDTFSEDPETSPDDKGKKKIRPDGQKREMRLDSESGEMLEDGEDGKRHSDSEDVENRSESENRKKQTDFESGEKQADSEGGKEYADNETRDSSGRVGILGLTPLEVCWEDDVSRILSVPGAVVYGAAGSLDEVRNAAGVRENLAVSPAGVMACRMLHRRFGTPYRTFYPLDEDFLTSLPDMNGRRILIVHQQVLANALREALRKRYRCGKVKVCSWFMMLEEGMEEDDVHLGGENDFVRAAEMADVIFADPVMRRLVPAFSGMFINLPHFAVSGTMEESRGCPAVSTGSEGAAASEKSRTVENL